MFMSFKTPGKVIATTLLPAMTASAHSNPIEFQSAPERTALLELYTSEGL